MRSARSLLTALATIALFPFAAAAFATDTDSDTLSDSFETGYGTSPSAADTDGDGWSDPHEIFVAGTDPNDVDTDGDGINDNVDMDPLLAPTGDPDGVNAATFTNAPTTYSSAASGRSPMDGVGVNLIDGGLYHALTTGGARGVRSLDFVLGLQYRSRSLWDGYFGTGWHSLFDLRCSVDGFSNFTVTMPSGDVVMWPWTGSGWDPPPGYPQLELTYDNPDYTITDPHGNRLVYRTATGLEKVEDKFNNAIDIVWTSGNPSSIVDSRGETHTIQYYSGTGRVKKLVMADGAEWTFRYNTKGQLHQILGPATTNFPFGILTEYRYTNGSTTAALNGNLIAAIDGKGQRWLSCEYDTADRVTEQKVGDSADPFVFDYSSAGSQQVTVTDRAGNERVWKWHATTLARTELTEKTNRNVRSGEGDYTTTWTNDGDGYLTEVEFPRGNGTKWTLNAAKLPTVKRRKADMGIADNDTNDLVEEWEYDDTKFYGVTSYTCPDGEETTYTLNSAGQATEIEFPELTHAMPFTTVTHEYTYNGDGTVATFTDGEGKVTAYDYFTTGAKKGRVQYVTVDDGGLDLVTEYDYEAWGDVKCVEDPRGNTTTYTVERYGNVTKIAAPVALGYETEFFYDMNLNVMERRIKNIDYDGTALTSPSQWITTYTYTAMDKVASVTEAVTSSVNRVTYYMYDDNDNLDLIDRVPQTTRMLHDERDLLYTRTRELDSINDPIEEFTYDGNRNLTAYENARGYVTTSTYDGFDRRTRTTNALGHYEEAAYDKDSRVTERKQYEEAGSTDVLMAHHKSHYDDMGRFWKEEDLLKGTSDVWYARTYTLDKRGLVTKVKDRRDYETTYAYDGAGRRTTATDPIGNIAAWTYDANGNAVEVEETEKIPGSGSTEVYETTFEFDAVNRLKKRTEIDRTNGSNTKVTEWKRSALNVVRKEIDPKGYETTRTADGLGRVTEESRDMGSSAAIVTQWTYDDHDAVTRLRDDNGNDTDYTYDDVGRLEEKSYEDATSVTYEYDRNGNVLTITDQMGTVIEQGFDELDRLTVRSATPATGVGGDTEHDFAYDALNRLTSAADDDSLVEYTYDSLSRVLTEKQGSNPFGSTAKTVTYTWDAEGNRTKILYPSSFEARETRDALGRITEIKDQSDVSVAAFDLYGPGLRKKKVTFGNTTTGNWSYDGFRRPVNIEHKTSGSSEFAGFEYDWDKNDNPLYEARSHKSGKGDVYSYDQANRLTKVLRDIDDPAAEIANPGNETYVKKLEYDMDDVFNLTAYKETPYGGSTTTSSFSANAMNEYTSVGGVTHLYHDNGSLKDDGTNEYKYDAWNHLIEVKRKSDSVVIGSYKYDAVGLGRRTKKTADSLTTRFLYADMQSVEELDDSDSDPLRLFVFGQQIDQIVMMEAPDQADVDDDSNTTEIKRFFYHTQLIGSVTHVTDASQTTVESYEYDPYGKPTIKDIGGNTVSASPIGNSYMFTARQLDEESGLYYFRAREFSSQLERFIQRDPLEYAEAPSAYPYCLARPAVLIDPLGEWPKWVKDVIKAVKDAVSGKVTPPPPTSSVPPWFPKNPPLTPPPSQPPPHGPGGYFGKDPRSGTPQVREWPVNPPPGPPTPTRDIDFHDHPKDPKIPNPHEHPWSRNPDGTLRRGPPPPGSSSPIPPPPPPPPSVWSRIGRVLTGICRFPLVVIDIGQCSNCGSTSCCGRCYDPSGG